MRQSPSITVGDTSRGARVEHLTSRGLIRLVRWTAGRVEDDAVGLEVSDFCARLELTDVLGPSRRYLLVAGAERPGAGHVVSLFDSEQDARAAFVSIRRSERGAEAWGEVIHLTTGGDARRLCWFGAPGMKYSRTDHPCETSTRTERTMRTIPDRQTAETAPPGRGRLRRWTGLVMGALVKHPVPRS